MPPSPAPWLLWVGAGFGLRHLGADLVHTGFAGTWYELPPGPDGPGTLGYCLRDPGATMAGQALEPKCPDMAPVPNQAGAGAGVFLPNAEGRYDVGLVVLPLA